MLPAENYCNYMDLIQHYFIFDSQNIFKVFFSYLTISSRNAKFRIFKDGVDLNLTLTYEQNYYMYFKVNQTLTFFFETGDGRVFQGYSTTVTEINSCDNCNIM